MKGVWLAAALSVFGLPGLAEQASTMGTTQGPTIRVQFSNPGLDPPEWKLEFHPDGSGHFKSNRKQGGQQDLRTIGPPDIDRDIHLTPKFAERAFQVARRNKLFNSECESHIKVAFQGTKTLSYEGPEGQGSCQFNYSRAQDIQALGDSFVAVATTVIEGARLETLLQHDPLGLDQEIQNVQDALGDGRAQQIGSIREILEKLADDPAVMERVRKRARALLTKADQ
jgi:hypothetical protein